MLAVVYDPVEVLPREELERLQLARLQEMVASLYLSSPFYRDKWSQVGFEPDDLRSLEDIRKLPLVTKEELREEQRLHPPFGRLTIAGRNTWRELHPSSGTTGTQVLTVWTEKDVENITNFTTRFLWGIGVRAGDVVHNAFSYGLWIAGMAVHYATKKLGAFVIPIGGLPVEHHVRLLRQVHPTAIFATPSFGLYLAETLKRQGLGPEDVGLRCGAFGGEAGVEVGGTRRRLEEGLGIRAYDIYGLSEIAPTMACECEAQAGLHWAEDFFLVEILDPITHEPVPDGEPGLLVITHLDREGTPMIRYATNDITTFTRSLCPCGRTHGRSPGGIKGRLDDLIVFRGAKFYPTEIEDVVRSLPGCTGEYYVEVRGEREHPAEVTVVAEADEMQVSAEHLRQRLRETLLVAPYVRLVPPGTLERTAFKAKRVVRMPE